jgi:hypothetical protein
LIQLVNDIDLGEACPLYIRYFPGLQRSATLHTDSITPPTGCLSAGPAPKWRYRIQASCHAPLDYPSRLQGLDASLNCLRHAVAARGVPIRQYHIENADLLHCSPQLARIAGSLDTPIIPCGAKQPEGRIRVERRSRTLRDSSPRSIPNGDSLSKTPRR